MAGQSPLTSPTPTSLVLGMGGAPVGAPKPKRQIKTRPQPDARAVIQPQPPALWLSLWHLQPLPAPDPFNALLVHQPAGVPQQRRDPPVAVTAILPRQGDDVGRQCRLVIRCLGRFALRRPRLAEHAAGKPFRYAELGHGVLYTIPAARRA